MRLCECPDFEEIITRAQKYFNKPGVSKVVVEKDYFITEVLRTINKSTNNKIIFKGGTSLSKGWDIVSRFSEDIDIFFDLTIFDPPLGRSTIDKELKKLRKNIESQPGLSFIKDESYTVSGIGRSDCFSYVQRFQELTEIKNRLIVEIGTASGKEPTEIVKIHSYVGRFLQDVGISFGLEDELPFEMRLLHFRRTFVEKLFAIHGKVERYKNSGKEIGKYARHYYDLCCLSKRPEVIQVLQSEEYDKILMDADLISKDHFSRDHVVPENKRFKNSDALFPPLNLENYLSEEYDRQCRIMCFGEFPAWKEVLQSFKDIRNLL